MRRSVLRGLKYLVPCRTKPSGSAATLVERYNQQDGASKHAANLPVSQRYFFTRQQQQQQQQSSSGGAGEQSHALLRLGAAQMLAPALQRSVGNLNEAHPLYYAQTSPREAGLCGQLVLALRKLHIGRLTELQGALVPLMLKGKHVIAHSETGTGKSFGIALAIANRIVRDSINYRLHTIVLVPTEELALQYDKWFRHFGGCTSQVVQTAIESIPLEEQLAKLHNIQPHVLVGTAQRIADINRFSPTILGEKLRKKVDCVVLDEADLVLQASVHYGRQTITGTDLVERILRTKQDEVPAQLVAASATVDGRTAQALNAWTRNDKAVRLTASTVEHSLPPTISFYFFPETRHYSLERGLELLLRLVCKQCAAPRVLLFAAADEVEPLCAALNDAAFLERAPEVRERLMRASGKLRLLAAPLHSLPDADSSKDSSKTGEHSGQGRKRYTVRESQIATQPGHIYVKNNSTLTQLNEGRLLIGVGSHEISRGLHVNGITHVILYGSCPASTHCLHCAGRTGRMGAEGDVVVLFPPSEGRQVQQVCRALDIPFRSQRLQQVDELLSGNNDFSTAASLETVAEENRRLEEEKRMRMIEFMAADASLV